jgi:plasmid stabilization system protein ParE
MVEKIEWSVSFARQIKDIIAYLRENSSDAVVNKFKVQLEQKIVKIAKNPTAHRKVTNRKTIRFSNLKPHFQIFYTVKGKILYITAIFDTRQNPNKRPY